MNWWLHALDCIEQNNVSADELIKKIDNSSSKSTTGLGSRGISSRSVANFYYSPWYLCQFIFSKNSYQ